MQLEGLIKTLVHVRLQIFFYAYFLNNLQPAKYHYKVKPFDMNYKFKHIKKFQVSFFSETNSAEQRNTKSTKPESKCNPQFVPLCVHVTHKNVTEI